MTSKTNSKGGVWVDESNPTTTKESQIANKPTIRPTKRGSDAKKITFGRLIKNFSASKEAVKPLKKDIIFKYKRLKMFDLKYLLSQPLRLSLPSNQSLHRVPPYIYRLECLFSQNFEIEPSSPWSFLNFLTVAWKLKIGRAHV